MVTGVPCCFHLIIIIFEVVIMILIRIWEFVGNVPRHAHPTLSGDGPSLYVDIYDAMNNLWTKNPTGLGQGRSSLAAASLPSGLVFFAGGWTGMITHDPS